MSERQHQAHHPYDHHPYDRLPDAVTELFGEGATAESAYDLLTVDVPATEWITALRTARDELGCSYFDWLSAVDEPGTGFRVCAHVAALGDGTVRRLMLRTTVPHDAAVLPSAIDVYAGAAWHERETHEMFGVAFEGHPGLAPLLLPEGFEGHPLRKDFVLAARVAKAWPGAKEPGESEHGGPKRRTMLPPGVPDPNEWGPLKGQLPPATARPGRAARPAAAADRPARRTRSVSEGSAAQRPQTKPLQPGGAEPGPSGAASPEPVPPPPVPPPPVTTPPGDESPGEVPPGSPPAARPRRSRSASDGSSSQQQTPEADASGPPRRSRSASQGSASQRARATDAPWHDAQPAFDDPDVSPVGPEAESGDAPSQPLRRSRSGASGAEPPVREGAGRGEAPPSGPNPDPTEPRTAPDPDRPPTDEATPTKPEPQSEPEPDHPAGGDTE
ncbi:NADH-quinone oxidoreductase subunit C [Streptomyces sp. ISL-112]|uniref:NADH-quinone oxidoreductase subunit C n=1 Tax=unclassified Streptomyces TaxID=2593676 RepID=UPI001BE594B6|nr:MULTISPECIES: NADH-quinone oxidoreductase subunit C [unclassified Streptomyces]MBT2424390.1 NADH-quinone oxidoreductase subunit C [Streptomyces sp. ISL-112]MBT2464925.1 NADH-quinone oxidoreductase subunit C [Streptomyces sp. ISL-63]